MNTLQNNSLSTEQLKNVQSLMTILQLSLLHRKPVGADRETGELYFIETAPSGERTYHPIDNETDECIFDINTENILTVDYQNLNPYIKPTFTLHQGYNEPTSSLQSLYKEPAFSLQQNEFLIDEGKRIKFNSRRIADILSHNIKDAELKNKAVNFENLILKKLSKKPSPASIRTTHNIYLEYIDIIDNQEYKISKLEVLTERLKETIPELEAKKNEHIRKKAEHGILRKIKIKAVSFLIVLSCAYGLYYYVNHDFNISFTDITQSNKAVMFTPNSAEYHRRTHPTGTGTAKGKVYTDAEIDKLINIYAEQEHVKVWAYRRNKIKQAFADKSLTAWQAKQIIIKQIELIKQ